MSRKFLFSSLAALTVLALITLSGGSSAQFLFFIQPANTPVPQTGLVTAVSVRKVVPTFTGAVMGVRATSGGTANIGFLASGNLDTATATATCTPNPCFITSLADQTGTAGNFTQANAAFQPALTISVAGGAPTIACGGYDNSAAQIQIMRAANSVSLTADMTVSAVVYITGSLTGAIYTDRGNLTPFNGWSIGAGLANPGNKFGFYQSTTKGATASPDTTSLWNTWPAVLTVTRTSGTIQFYVNGVATSSVAGHGNPSAADSLPVLCSNYTNNTPSNGMKGAVSEVLVYNSALTGSTLTQLINSQKRYFPPTSNVPYQGAAGLVTSSLGNAAGQTLTQAGGVNQFENTQAFTLGAQFKCIGAPAVATVLYTNVLNTSPFTGATEFFINPNGFLHARVISNFPNNYAGKHGSIQMCDGKSHTVAYSYSGSKTAAGMILYEDGVVDPAPIVEADTLTGTSIGANNIPSICTQAGELNFTCQGPLGFLVLYNVVKSAGYITTNFTPPHTPPCDSDAVTCFFNFPTTGVTTVTDGAAVPHNGTVATGTGATMSFP